ncbi:hypothetical protein [Aeromonas phage AS-yj]|uniref:Uncharacterized protein n=6 Tax=Caudoviricetes TaxID=2731619 RepID=A0A291LEQ7_9CAUD|nr:hypothetical protein HWB28_gp079 [Aeromonas phage AS-zj]YP_009835012.1 hypothetical protein HWB29_gp310 [Aeromonas phage AS-sw]ATI17523.1 hypothetical protein [Aeromonas phage AS-szw]ATI17985.1 hypothetical protein [Aeromonas phage AS-yj]QAX97965.1 hypothetical protein ASswx1_323 [Aeromonas phage Asswx_1]ASU00473.1 hypothetical protein [Aeromonas phage AS-zj]ATI18360.1 hypothetical protein [Aeromonas phage AS-sw]
MFYALRKKGTKGIFVGIHTVGSQGDFQNGVQACFSLECYIPFITNRVGYLERVLSGEHDVPWYNSEPQNPELEEYYKTGKGYEALQEYEIVELGVIDEIC